MSRFIVEDTHAGYRLTLLDSTSGEPRHHFDEPGGHGPLEQIFMAVERQWVELRSGQVAERDPLGERMRQSREIERREAEAEYCDECGAVVPADATGVTGPWHEEICSAYEEANP